MGSSLVVARHYLRKASLAFHFLGIALLILLSSLAVATSVPAEDVSDIVTIAQGGEPLAKIQVALLATGATTVTGSDGKFNFSQVPTGRYVLQIGGVGYRSSKISFQLASGDDTKEFSIALAPDNFRFSDRVEVTGGVLEPKDWPAAAELTLTSSELRKGKGTCTIAQGRRGAE